MAYIFESERARFRVWEPRDAIAAFELWGDPEVMRHIEPALTHIDQAKRCIEAGRAHFDAHGVQHWAMECKESEAILGCCGFSHEESRSEEQKQTLELVIHLMRARWGVGLGTEAVRAALMYAQGQLGAPRVIAATALDNHPMKRILSRVGMRALGEIWYDDTQRYELLHEIDTARDIIT